MSDQWLDTLNQTTPEGRDSTQCDGCAGIQGAANDEVCDHRCDLCRRPLSCVSVWLDANRGHLSQTEVEAVSRVLLPEQNKDYRVRYWSVVLERGMTTGLMTKGQAEFMAGSMRGTVIRESV